MDEEKIKKIDESWKEAVQKEKEKTGKTEEPRMQPPKADFGFFISSLAMESLIALGDVENPMTKKTSVNLKQAEYLIDTIDIIRQKTEGNLTAQEKVFIENVLSDLKMRYVNKTK